MSTTSGKGRTNTVLLKRVKKARTSGHRVKQLRRQTPQAKWFCKTNLDPCQSYGAAVAGPGPNITRELRRNMARALANAGRTPCTTTIIAYELGPSSDPGIAHPTRQFPSGSTCGKRGSPKSEAEYGEFGTGSLRGYTKSRAMRPPCSQIQRGLCMPRSQRYLAKHGNQPTQTSGLLHVVCSSAARR